MPIRIRSIRGGFRRCGIAHPAEMVEYPDDRFTSDEIEIMTSDPMLVVELVGKAQATRENKLKEQIEALQKELSAIRRGEDPKETSPSKTGDQNKPE